MTGFSASCITGQRGIPFGAAVILAVCAGCWSSSSPTGGVTAYGQVRIKGSPLPDGEITFESVEDGVGVGVTRIQAGGNFQLFLRPSTYRVSVVSVEGGLSPAGFAGVEASRIRVPEKYAVPNTSGIEVKVDASHRHVVLDLEP